MGIVARGKTIFQIFPVFNDHGDLLLIARVVLDFMARAIAGSELNRHPSRIQALGEDWKNEKKNRSLPYAAIISSWSAFYCAFCPIFPSPATKCAGIRS